MTESQHGSRTTQSHPPLEAIVPHRWSYRLPAQRLPEHTLLPSRATTMLLVVGAFGTRSLLPSTSTSHAPAAEVEAVVGAAGLRNQRHPHPATSQPRFTGKSGDSDTADEKSRTRRAFSLPLFVIPHVDSVNFGSHFASGILILGAVVESERSQSSSNSSVNTFEHNRTVIEV